MQITLDPPGDGCTCATSDTRLFDEQLGYEAVACYKVSSFLWAHVYSNKVYVCTCYSCGFFAVFISPPLSCTSGTIV